MAMTEEQRKEEAYKRLRSFLNPVIRGPNTTAVLRALATSKSYLIQNVEAVYDQMFIVSASEQYLDARLADRNITRPESVGLSDDVFRQLGIAISTRKQVRDLILQIIEVVYGEDYTRATLDSSEFEIYSLEDGDSLRIQFDDGETAEVVFTTDQFTNISQATAQEVADAITKDLRRLGFNGFALAKDDGSGNFVQIISGTIGPASTIRVVGGKAQNKLKFPAIRPTSGVGATQWTITQESGGIVRATWSGGPNPSVGKVRKGDYVNIYGTAFNEANRGTFTITDVKGGLINDAYVEFENPNGVPEITVQGNEEGILFFNPQRVTSYGRIAFATAFQTEARLLEVFLYATTKIVRRVRIGAAHVHDSGGVTNEDYGPHIFDTSKPYLIGSQECNITQNVDASSNFVVTVDDSIEFPDQEGFLVFGFGTDNEEGPVKYLGRPSSNTLFIDPAYKFKNFHPAGTNISLVESNSVYDPAKDGTDYPFYVTDVVSGRLYAEELIKLVAATGINLVVNIIYPNPEGLENWGKKNPEAQTWKDVWNSDKV
jgi:hypothetical protein